MSAKTNKPSPKSRNLRLVEAAVLHQSDQNPDLGYCWLPLVSSSLPVRKTSSLHHLTGSGKQTLEIVADERFGLPFGKFPRLFMVWLATEACRTKSKKICLGPTYSSLMNICGVGISSRGKRQRVDFFNQVQRLAESKFRVIRNSENETSIKYFLLMDEFCFSKKSNMNHIIISDWFFDESQKVAPVEMAVVVGLSDKPLALDLYFWANWRNKTLGFSKKKTVFLHWNLVVAQFGTSYTRQRNMVAAFKQAATEVKCFVPLALEIGDVGILLKFTPPKISQRRKKSGVGR